MSVVVCTPAQAVGRLRNGVLVRSTAVPPPVHAGTQLCPRWASWAASDGTPQNVSFEVTTPPSGARFATLLIVKNNPESVVSRTPPMMSVRGARKGTAKAKSDTWSAAACML